MSKKIISLMLVLVLAISIFPVNALAVNDERAKEILISSDSYVDEAGNLITDRLYFEPVSSGPMTRGASGSGYYRQEKNITWDGGSNVSVIWVKAYFVWGNGDVSVSSASTGTSGYVPTGGSLNYKSLTTGTGQFLGLFNKYAYAEAKYERVSVFGIRTEFTVRIQVSESGNVG